MSAEQAQFAHGCTGGRNGCGTSTLEVAMTADAGAIADTSAALWVLVSMSYAAGNPGQWGHRRVMTGVGGGGGAGLSTLTATTSC